MKSILIVFRRLLSSFSSTASCCRYSSFDLRCVAAGLSESSSFANSYRKIFGAVGLGDLKDLFLGPYLPIQKFGNKSFESKRASLVVQGVPILLAECILREYFIL